MDRPDDNVPVKRCRKCGQAKDVEAFARSSQTRDRRHAWCRACNLEASRRSRSGKTAAERERRERERIEAANLAEVERQREHHRWLLGIKAGEDAAHARARQRRS